MLSLDIDVMETFGFSHRSCIALDGLSKELPANDLNLIFNYYSSRYITSQNKLDPKWFQELPANNQFYFL